MSVHVMAIMRKITISLLSLPLITVKLIEPFKRIRFCFVGSETFRLCSDLDIYLRMREKGALHTNTTLIVVPVERVINHTLLSLWDQHGVLISGPGFLVRLLNILRPAMERLGVVDEIPRDADSTYFYGEVPSRVTLTADHHNKGQAALEKMGIGKDDWYVCFHSRDAAFRNAMRPVEDKSVGGSACRDSHVENYLPSAEEITRRGGYALRMNAWSDAPLQTENPKIIDYATHYRTDFMDIFLGAKNRFFLGNSSGLFLIPLMFNKPVGSANWIPPGDPSFCKHHITIPKLYRWKGESRILSFPELYSLKLFHSTATFSSEYTYLACDVGFDQLNLEPIENTADEILDLTLDLFDMVEGHEPSPEFKEIQMEYARRFWAHFDCYPILARNKGFVSSRFLMRHKHLFSCDPEYMQDTERRLQQLTQHKSYNA